jgi:hypothetical protein
MKSGRARVSRTYYWKLTQLSGAWTTGGNWINDPGGWSGRVPGPGDYAEIGSLTSPVTVTLSSTVGFLSLALGGTGGVLPTVDINGGHMYVADNPFGRITDSWSTRSGQSFSGGGTISLRNNGSLYVGGSVASGINVTFDGTTDILYLGGATLGSPHPGIFGGKISGFGGTGEIVLSHINYNVRDSFTYNGGVLSIFSPTHTNILNLSINLPTAGFALIPFPTGGPNIRGKLTIVVCFAAGTRILTGAGEVPVESLAEGDQVVTLDAGAHVPRPVRWLGRRRVNLAAHPDPESAAPVRIRAGAFAPLVPVRDLLLSPDHAVFVEGKLIPAKLLVNGGTIVQELSCPEIEYFHVELDCHAVLFADGLTAESYLDTGNRAFFANAGLALVLHPEFTVNAALKCWHDDACAPLTVNEAEIEPVWRRLAERAAALGHALPQPETKAAAELVLEARGQVIRAAQIVDGRHIFALPAGLDSVRLISRSASPATLRPWLADRRRLGVKVSRLVLDGRTVAADDAMLAEGWWEVEADGRWTDGGGVLLLSEAPTMLEVQVATTLPAYPVEAAERLAA